MKIQLPESKNFVTFLNASNAEEGAYKILGAEETDFGSGYAVRLEHGDETYALTLNQTNLLKLIELFGDETDDWTRKTIWLKKVKVEYKGRRVPGLRIMTKQEFQE
jgi:hypothetical protein